MPSSHIAYIVTDPNDSSPDARATWREVGILFPHKSGKGWDLLLHPQIAVSGRIVITERRERGKIATEGSEGGP